MIEQKNLKVVTKVSIPATLRQMPRRTEARFLVRELGKESSLKSAVSRFNTKRKTGRISWRYGDDNLRTYIITRN